MAGFYDFDAARAARRAAGPVLRAFGDEVRLPTSMPAALVLLRARVRDEGLVTVAMATEQLRTMVGAHIDTWMADNPDLDEDDLVDLLANCVRLINESEPDVGEASAPAPGASGSPTSSSSGRSSKRTSPGTTASTSPRRSSKKGSSGGGSTT